MKPQSNHEVDPGIATQLAALAHPARVEILRHLTCNDCCSCKEVVGQLDLAQSTVSQHLKVLVEAGLVHFEPHKQRSRYSADRAALRGLARSVTLLVDGLCQNQPETGICCGPSQTSAA